MSCTPKPSQQQSVNISVADSSILRKPIDSVLREHTNAWMQIPGVTGTGETEKNGKPAIVIFVDTLTAPLRARLPDSAETYPVVIVESGRVLAR